MSRPRIVIDTNLLISAAIRPTGQPARLLELVAYRAVEMFISEEVLAEYREVFSRPKFSHLSPQRVALLLTLIAREATVVKPTERLAVSQDEPDNRFYECAAAAQADYLITGNIRHFKTSLKGTRVVTVRQFLETTAGSLSSLQ